MKKLFFLFACLFMFPCVAYGGSVQTTDVDGATIIKNGDNGSGVTTSSGNVEVRGEKGMNVTSNGEKGGISIAGPNGMSIVVPKDNKAVKLGNIHGH